MARTPKKRTRPSHKGLTVAELFAGVGGFRIGLEKTGWEVVWSNQWEPATKTQHASDCYVHRFTATGHVCGDIEKIVEGPPEAISSHELLVGGFPCQDYSVARPLPHATGLQGRKGVLWWSIYRVLEVKRPPFVLLENVDRLLSSPSSQRGRDFAVILSCLAQLGYVAEWRVVNAAEYGFPQRRRRVFLYAHRLDALGYKWQPMRRMYKDGVLSRALPIKVPSSIARIFEQDGGETSNPTISLDANPYVVSETFGRGCKVSPFKNTGVMIEGGVWTVTTEPRYRGKLRTLRDVVNKTGSIPPEFFLKRGSLKVWKYLKGAKAEPRVDKATGHEYFYAEGGVGFPDSLDKPARTILTGEGGSGPSRFKHVIRDPKTGRLRRLIPEELEELNGFPRGWTDAGMSDSRRAFMMGNALVVGIVQRIGRVIRKDAILWSENGKRNSRGK